MFVLMIPIPIPIPFWVPIWIWISISISIARGPFGYFRGGKGGLARQRGEKRTVHTTPQI